MQKSEVKSLIESIKSQTEQLKNTVRNCVGIKKIAATSPSNEPTSSISKKPFSRKKLNHETSEVLLRNPDVFNYSELQNPEIVRDLMEENEELRTEIQILKKSLIATVNQCKALKKELDEERRKNNRLCSIETEYSKEKRKNTFLHEKNFELKKQTLGLMSKIKVFLSNCEKDSLETNQVTSQLIEENEVLRDIVNKPPINLGATTPEKNKPIIPNENSSKNLKDLTEEYKMVKEKRKENKEKIRLEAKNKEKNSNIFSYFQNSNNEILSADGLSNSQSIIDMYEEKILQNSIKSAISITPGLNVTTVNSSNRDKSPLLSGTIRRK